MNGLEKFFSTQTCRTTREPTTGGSRKRRQVGVDLDPTPASSQPRKKMWVWASKEDRRCAICHLKLAWSNEYPTCGQCFEAASKAAKWRAGEACRREEPKGKCSYQDRQSKEHDEESYYKGNAQEWIEGPRSRATEEEPQ